MLLNSAAASGKHIRAAEYADADSRRWIRELSADSIFANRLLHTLGYGRHMNDCRFSNLGCIPS